MSEAVKHSSNNLKSTAVRLGASALLIIWLFIKTDKASLAKVLHHTNWSLVPAALLCTFVCVFLATLRWSYILKAMEMNLPYAGLLKSNFVGLFFNLFTPSTIGQDTARIVDFRTAGVSTAGGTMSVMFDRMLGLLALLLMAVAAFPFAADKLPDKRTIGIVIFLIAGALLTVGLMFIPLFAQQIKKIASRILPASLVDWMRDCYFSVQKMRSQPTPMVISFLCALAFQVMIVITNYWIALAVGVNIPFSAHMLIVPLILLVTAVPLSINGIGLREWAFVNLWGVFGISREQALTASLTFFSMWLVMGVVGMIIYLTRKHALAERSMD